MDKHCLCFHWMTEWKRILGSDVKAICLQNMNNTKLKAFRVHRRIIRYINLQFIVLSLGTFITL